MEESEKQLIRSSAQLSSSLYYYLKGFRSLEERCLSLGDSLSVINIVNKIISSSPPTNSNESIELMRSVETRLKQRHGKYSVAGFGLAHWSLIASELNIHDENGRRSMGRRISDEFEVLWKAHVRKKDDKVFSYVQRSLLNWGIGKYDEEYFQPFFQLLIIYASSFGESSRKVHDLFMNEPLINSEFKNLARSVFTSDRGIVKLIHGSGSFSTIPENKILYVSPGSVIKGTIEIEIKNNKSFDFITPLIRVLNWEPKNYHVINGRLQYGDQFEQDMIDVKAPMKKGTYYILFAFSHETEGKYVASATNWRIDYPVWDDGNDLPNLDISKIESAQQNGHVDVTWLSEEGYTPNDLPCDAITIKVS